MPTFYILNVLLVCLFVCFYFIIDISTTLSINRIFFPPFTKLGNNPVPLQRNDKTLSFTTATTAKAKQKQTLQNKQANKLCFLDL